MCKKLADWIKYLILFYGTSEIKNKLEKNYSLDAESEYTSLLPNMLKRKWWFKGKSIINYFHIFKNQTGSNDCLPTVNTLLTCQLNLCPKFNHSISRNFRIILNSLIKTLAIFPKFVLDMQLKLLSSGSINYNLWRRNPTNITWTKALQI